MKDNLQDLLSDIKEEELDKTATFTDIISKREYKKRKKEALVDDGKTIVEEADQEVNVKEVDPAQLTEFYNDKEKKSPLFSKFLGAIGLFAAFAFLGFYFVRQGSTSAIDQLVMIGVIFLVSVLLSISELRKTKTEVCSILALLLLFGFMIYLAISIS